MKVYAECEHNKHYHTTHTATIYYGGKPILCDTNQPGGRYLGYDHVSTCHAEHTVCLQLKRLYQRKVAKDFEDEDCRCEILQWETREQ